MLGDYLMLLRRVPDVITSCFIQTSEFLCPSPGLRYPACEPAQKAIERMSWRSGLLTNERIRSDSHYYLTRERASVANLLSTKPPLLVLGPPLTTHARRAIEHIARIIPRLGPL